MRKTKKIAAKLSDVQIESLQNSYTTLVYLNSNNENNTSYIACGEKHSLAPQNTKVFENLKQFIDKHKDWVFGYFNYDLKTEVEPQLSSNNLDYTEMVPNHFFVPEILIQITKRGVFAHHHNSSKLNYFLEALNSSNLKDSKSNAFEIKERETKADYLEKIRKVKEQIQQGNIYEMNYCHQFYADNVLLNPFKKYIQLNEITKAPFSSFYKNDCQYILSASPERFLKKEGNTITSQPIKGTAKRGATIKEDNRIKKALENDQKERSENIMIVDLVRNDLAKTAAKGSVKVNELCKVYSFDTVHQMISTVTSKIDKHTHPVEVIKQAFPMGSMTGAPKVEAMKLIEQFEEAKRGIYSGAIGYFTPQQDFDFNVVIRSILYNEKLHKLSFTVGGAITINSNPKSEYKETLLKGNALLQALKKQ